MNWWHRLAELVAFVLACVVMLGWIGIIGGEGFLWWTDRHRMIPKNRPAMPQVISELRREMRLISASTTTLRQDLCVYGSTLTITMTDMDNGILVDYEERPDGTKVVSATEVPR